MPTALAAARRYSIGRLVLVTFELLVPPENTIVSVCVPQSLFFIVAQSEGKRSYEVCTCSEDRLIEPLSGSCAKKPAWCSRRTSCC